jgi:hypothetical protein
MVASTSYAARGRLMPLSVNSRIGPEDVARRATDEQARTIARRRSFRRCRQATRGADAPIVGRHPSRTAHRYGSC